MWSIYLHFPFVVLYCIIRRSTIFFFRDFYDLHLCADDVRIIWILHQYAWMIMLKVKDCVFKVNVKWQRVRICVFIKIIFNKYSLTNTILQINSRFYNVYAHNLASCIYIYIFPEKKKYIYISIWLSMNKEKVLWNYKRVSAQKNII